MSDARIYQYLDDISKIKASELIKKINSREAKALWDHGNEKEKNMLLGFYLNMHCVPTFGFFSPDKYKVQVLNLDFPSPGDFYRKHNSAGDAERKHYGSQNFIKVIENAATSDKDKVLQLFNMLVVPPKVNPNPNFNPQKKQGSGGGGGGGGGAHMPPMAAVSSGRGGGSRKRRRKRRRKIRRKKRRRKTKRKRRRRRRHTRRRLSYTVTRKAGLTKLKRELLKKKVFSRPPLVTPIFPNPHKESAVSSRPR